MSSIALCPVFVCNFLYITHVSPKAAMFGQEMHPSVYEKAAAYLYHLVCNHPFNDANKRTGFTITLVFLEVNNAKQAFQKEDLENLVIEVAKGKETKERISRFLKYGSLEQRFFDREVQISRLPCGWVDQK